MKTLTFVVLAGLLCLFISCNQEDTTQESIGIITGRVIGDSSHKEISLLGYMTDFTGDKKVITDKNGVFRFELQLPATFDFRFIYDSTGGTIRIGPGDSIHIEIQPSEDQKILFSGDHSGFLSELNNFNTTFRLKDIPYADYMHMFKELPPMEYLDWKTSQNELNKKILIQTFDSLNTSESVRNHVLRKLNVKLAIDLCYYLNMATVLQNAPYMTKPPEKYRQVLDSLVVTTKNDYWVSDYGNLLSYMSVMNSHRTEDGPSSGHTNRNKLRVIENQIKGDLDYFDHFQSDYLLTRHLYSLINTGSIKDDIFIRYTGFLENEFFKNVLDKKYTEYKLIQSAEIDSAKIHLHRINATDSSSIFKGLKETFPNTILYVDIWATWCGTCIASFAYTPTLKEQLTDVEIEFIYLAVSSPEDLWEKVIKQHKLTGNHYLLNEYQKKELYNYLPLNGIPHYFIIDKSGEIIIPDAHSPQSSKAYQQILLVNG